MNTQNPETTLNPAIEPAIQRTNECAENLETARNRLFEVVRESVIELGDSTADLKHYRTGIKKSHRSTVYVMITAASNKLLTRFKNEMPASYQTLYELHKLNCFVGDDRTLELIESGEINAKMTKADVTRLRESEKTKLTETSEEDAATSQDETPEDAATSQTETTDNVVGVTFESSERIKISTLDEMKSAFHDLDESIQKEFAAYVATLINQQSEAA